MSAVPEIVVAAEPRTDRDEVFLELTKSICPVCKRVLDAEVNVRDNKVFLRKRCPDHGEFEALVYGDAQMYMDSMRFNKPGTLPLQTQTEVVDGCPLDCGLCPEHKQHACVGLIEVNSNCNLDCPICFADSGHQPDGFSLTREQVEAGIDAFVRAEGEPEVLMLSGGEPSIHPQILEFIAMARAKGIRHVVLNTNGIRLASDRAFAVALAEQRTSIYLQFDGLREDTHVAIRGRDLREIKRRALANCEAAGLSVTLVAAPMAFRCWWKNSKPTWHVNSPPSNNKPSWRFPWIKRRWKPCQSTNTLICMSSKSCASLCFDGGFHSARCTQRVD